ncbi:MAG: prephenate dehydrogenase [Planctomycetaceae bacterium]
MRVAIIGAGLLGGSFGLAFRRLHPSAEVIGVSRSPSSRDAALACGAVTAVSDALEPACRDADLVVVAVPVDGIASMVLRAAELCLDDALVIDLGSTKASIVRTVDANECARAKFVGTHPIAGSEKTGAEHARADLFKSKTLIVTPGQQTPPELVDRAEMLWRSLETNVVRMTPEDHDRAMASISHVPHLVASMIAALLPPDAGRLVGSGWIDTTRVASGDAELWTAICRENSMAIGRELQSASGWLTKMADCIARGDFDGVRQMLEESKRIRDAVVSAGNRC